MTMRTEELEQWAAVLRELRALFIRDPRTKPDLRAWENDSIALWRRIRSSYRVEVCDRMDEVAWHYLSDADLRVKDSEYAEMQRAEFEQWLLQAEKRLAGG